MPTSKATTLSRKKSTPSKSGKRKVPRPVDPEHQSAADATATRQRDMQLRQDERDRKTKATGTRDSSSGAVQAGARRQPERLPAQHQTKPGDEKSLALAPRYSAPSYKGSGKLQDGVALITGGDSGIGRAVAVLYAREGADVVIVYLNEHEDAEETARCVEAEGQQCLLLPGDVRDPRFCDQAVEQTIGRFGRLDVLVNNAAFQLHAASLEDIDDGRLAETLQTNVLGYFHMARSSLPHLKQGAAIVNTGSVTGLEGSAHLLDYAATKGAIHAFTKSLAKNLIDKGIRVNAVAPGPVWTPLNPADAPSDKVREFGRKTDMKRAAQPEEIAPAYVFLASPACAGYITGLVLPITGSVGAI